MYIDPGTGSFLAQLVAAAVFGTLLTVKHSWRRVARFFGREAKVGQEAQDA